MTELDALIERLRATDDENEITAIVELIKHHRRKGDANDSEEPMP